MRFMRSASPSGEVQPCLPHVTPRVPRSVHAKFYADWTKTVLEGYTQTNKQTNKRTKRPVSYHNIFVCLFVSMIIVRNFVMQASRTKTFRHEDISSWFGRLDTKNSNINNFFELVQNVEKLTCEKCWYTKRLSRTYRLRTAPDEKETRWRLQVAVPAKLVLQFWTLISRI